MNNAAINQAPNPARTAILKSIRDHLAQSAESDAVNGEEKAAIAELQAEPAKGQKRPEHRSPAEMFREELEAVGGHCIVVRGEVAAARALGEIISKLTTTLAPKQRIALSDAPLVKRIIGELAIDVEHTPSAADLFNCEVGVTSAQAAIAETGTLVLESESERHRLVSLLPPVHIAILNAADICLTLSEALKLVRRNGSTTMSRTITFITGPSRTADIELTLAIGVHGPQELYVIIDEETPSPTN